jgi:hypothetical protein
MTFGHDRWKTVRTSARVPGTGSQRVSRLARTARPLRWHYLSSTAPPSGDTPPQTDTSLDDPLHTPSEITGYVTEGEQVKGKEQLSASVHDSLVGDAGWPHTDYEAWLKHTLVTALLR